MAKLHFRYGAMESSKTAAALMLAYNFRSRGGNPLLAKPADDVRTEKMWSRVGIEADCITLEEVCDMPFSDIGKYDCVVVDEVQFATTAQINKLAEIADYVNIPVFTYGLRTGYTGELFEGSKRLFEIADVLECLPTVCWCKEEATMTAYVVDGKVTKDPSYQQAEALKGEFTSLCRKHWNEGRLR